MLPLLCRVGDWEAAPRSQITLAKPRNAVSGAVTR